MARAITVTQAGRAHPLLASRPAVFDALCSHLDEIETLPPNSEVLAANELSAIQAIATQTPWRGSFLGTQYHPEHTLAVSAAIIEMRATELVEEGFGTEPSEIAAIAADYRALDAEPTRRDLIWRYGIASEIMDPIRRTTEIGNWLRTVVEPRRLWLSCILEASPIRDGGGSGVQQLGRSDLAGPGSGGQGYPEILRGVPQAGDPAQFEAQSGQRPRARQDGRIAAAPFL